MMLWVEILQIYITRLSKQIGGVYAGLNFQTWFDINTIPHEHNGTISCQAYPVEEYNMDMFSCLITRRLQLECEMC